MLLGVGGCNRDARLQWLKQNRSFCLKYEYRGRWVWYLCSTAAGDPRWLPPLWSATPQKWPLSSRSGWSFSCHIPLARTWLHGHTSCKAEENVLFFLGIYASTYKTNYSSKGRMGIGGHFSLWVRNLELISKWAIQFMFFITKPFYSSCAFVNWKR